MPNGNPGHQSVTPVMSESGPPRKILKQSKLNSVLTLEVDVAKCQVRFTGTLLGFDFERCSYELMATRGVPGYSID